MSINTFKRLSKIDVGEHIEKKNGLSYLSWPYAWSTFCMNVENPSYTVYERTDGTNYWTDGMTAWVKVGVSDGENEFIEMLPIMDFKNRAIPIGSVTSFEVNKAIQRAMVKAIARHGLGLYIYAGEDFPDKEDGQKAPQNAAPVSKASKEDVVKMDGWFKELCASYDVNAGQFLIDDGVNVKNVAERYQRIREYKKMWDGDETLHLHVVDMLERYEPSAS